MTRKTPIDFTRAEREVAQQHPNGALWLWGDYSGRSYVSAPARDVSVGEDVLHQLAIDLDARFKWSLASATGLWWVVMDREPQGVWLDPRLIVRGVKIDDVQMVFAGHLSRIQPTP